MSSKIEETKLATTLIEDTVITLPAITQEELPELTRRLMVSQQCHLGNVRNRNEDSILVFNTFSGGQEPLFPFGLYIVADGMGGIMPAMKLVSRPRDSSLKMSWKGYICRYYTEGTIRPRCPKSRFAMSC